jgi:hypothetical protein
MPEESSSSSCSVVENCFQLCVCERSQEKLCCTKVWDSSRKENRFNEKIWNVLLAPPKRTMQRQHKEAVPGAPCLIEHCLLKYSMCQIHLFKNSSATGLFKNTDN